MIRQPMVWEEKEYNHTPKTQDWYWGVAVVVVSLSALCFIFGNYLLGFVLIIGFFALALLASKDPAIIRFEINNNGIVIGQTMHAYSSMSSFCVIDKSHEGGRSKLLVESKKAFAPLISIPIDKLNPQIVRDFMLDHIKEKERDESVTEKIFDFLGF